MNKNRKITKFPKTVKTLKLDFGLVNYLGCQKKLIYHGKVMCFTCDTVPFKLTGHVLRLEPKFAAYPICPCKHIALAPLQLLLPYVLHHI